ncbi:short-chain dehydrogenase/reductase SDR [Methylobacterium sp. 4-46]|uniref:SDR family NAD(P)-dependent oxidoreductase n=1 Tax=unclassified Methylobacterium TaxID=2615210 RepID=UPI000165CBF1|nr:MULTISPECIES: glucose 1-dehydrogenase [Methylobacterium]ACA20598.1 short-chain dehydrogenase/reductase SDR [Methylobacterium sp. 4-46]WFT79761.1 SDR family oxidoreductase [Methylobacterium nodulans]
MPDRLIGKTAIVFGAGSAGTGWGNGKAAAVAFAREGARVVCVDRLAEAAEETAHLIAEEGNDAEALAADVTDSEAVVRAVAAAERRFGGIDILHNNVGLAEPGGPEDLDEAAWRRAIEVNVGGVWRTCRAVLPGMRARRRGAVVNISSVASIRWTGAAAFAYGAAKAAVNQATVAVAMQYARDGIRANAILPGLLDTSLRDDCRAAGTRDAGRDRLVPLGRLGEAWDIAHAAVFLASDEARFITGVCLPVDGGQSCSMAHLA